MNIWTWIETLVSTPLDWLIHGFLNKASVEMMNNEKNVESFIRLQLVLAQFKKLHLIFIMPS